MSFQKIVEECTSHIDEDGHLHLSKKQFQEIMLTALEKGAECEREFWAQVLEFLPNRNKDGESISDVIRSRGKK